MQSNRCKKTHTGLWEYFIAIAWRDRGKKRFTIGEMISKVNELETACSLPRVSKKTMMEQLTSRCCAQGSTSFVSLLNYFNKEEKGVYSLFDPEIHKPIGKRIGLSNVPTDTIVKHIHRRHTSDLQCILKHLNIRLKDTFAKKDLL